MKALSVRQPWASLIAIGKKTIETRSWATNYRGKLLIVSSKTGMDKDVPYRNLLSLGLPFGKAIAIAELIDCRQMREEDEEDAMSPFHWALYAWVLKDIKKIEPFPVKGKLGLYEVEIAEKGEKG